MAETWGPSERSRYNLVVFSLAVSRCLLRTLDPKGRPALLAARVWNFPSGCDSLPRGVSSDLVMPRRGLEKGQGGVEKRGAIAARTTRKFDKATRMRSPYRIQQQPPRRLVHRNVEEVILRIKICHCRTAVGNAAGQPHPAPQACSGQPVRRSTDTRSIHHPADSSLYATGCLQLPGRAERNGIEDARLSIVKS